MILYQTELSSVSRKLRVALALKGVEVALRVPPGGSYRSAEYRALVPVGSVPSLVDGALVLSESDAIIEYLEELYPARPLLPGTPGQRARIRMLSRLHDFRIDQPLRALYPQIRTQGRDEAVVAAAFGRLAEGLAVIAGQADPAGPFLAGEVPTMADCAWPANFLWMDAMSAHFGVALPVPERLGVVRAALAAHPVVAGAMAGYPALVSAWVAAAG